LQFEFETFPSLSFDLINALHFQFPPFYAEINCKLIALIPRSFFKWILFGLLVILLPRRIQLQN